MTDPVAEEPLLRVEDLTVRYPGSEGTRPALRGLSLAVRAGEILALLGESGAGKSTLALALMGLLPPGAVLSGRASLAGDDLLAGRGPRPGLAMVFQEPAAALHPLWRVGALVAEPLRQRFGLPRDAARAEAVRLLAQAGLPAPEALAAAFPHQLSGGQQQRVLLAMALACRPRLLLADEPTAALDAVTRAGVVAQLSSLARERGLAVLVVGHDPGLVASVASRVAVLYAGALVEVGPADALLAAPAHPYTRALLACAPGASGGTAPPQPIPGPPLDPRGDEPGCAFHPRCALAADRCLLAPPPLRPFAAGPGWQVACHAEGAA